MGFTDRDQVQRCPCYNRGEGFHKVIDLEDNGLVIYCYVGRKENVDVTENNPPHTVVILQNTKNTAIVSADLLPELDKNKITCPRCKQIFRHAQELLHKVPGIDKFDVMGICEHCRLQARTPEPCNECEKILHKFLSSHGTETIESKKITEPWPTTNENILAAPRDVKSRTHADIAINLSRLANIKSTVKAKAQIVFHSDVNLSDINIFKKKKRHIKSVDLEKGIHFTEFNKPVQIFRTPRSDSTVRDSDFDKNVTDIPEKDNLYKYNASKGANLNRPNIMTKYKYDKDKMELAINTSKERMAEYKRKLKSGQKFIDFDLHKDFSFFFPEASQVSLRKSLVHVNSSQIIRFIQKKMGLQIEEEEKKISNAMEENLKIDKQENKHQFKDTRDYMKGQLEDDKEQALIAEPHKIRKINDNDSDTTRNKTIITIKPKQTDQMADEAEYGIREREEMPIKITEGRDARRTKQSDDNKKSTEERRTNIDNETGKHKIVEKYHESPKKKSDTPKSLAQTEPSKQAEIRSKENKNKQIQLDEQMQVKSKGDKGDKSIAREVKKNAVDKEALRIPPEKTAAALKSDRTEKEKGKSKKVEQGLENIKLGEPKRIADLDSKHPTPGRVKDNKINQKDRKEETTQVISKGDKLSATQAKAHPMNKATTNIISEKSDTILSRRREKTEISQQNLKKVFRDPKHTTDSKADKKTVEGEEKKQHREGLVQGKLKDIISKQKRNLPPETKTGKETEPGHMTIKPIKKQNSEDDVTMKHIADHQKNKNIDKQTEKKEKKSQHEEQAIEAKAKNVLTKQNKIFIPEKSIEKSGPKTLEKVDTTLKTKQKGQEPLDPQIKQPVNIEMAAVKKPTPSEHKVMQLIVDMKSKKAQEKIKPINDDSIKTKPIRQEKPVFKAERERTVKPIEINSENEVIVSMTNIRLINRSLDDTMLKLIRIKQSEPRRRRSTLTPPVDPKIMEVHKEHKHVKNKKCIICNNSDLELDCDLYNARMQARDEMEDIIIGEDLLQYRQPFFPIHEEPHELQPMLFKHSLEYIDEPTPIPSIQVEEVQGVDEKVDPDSKKGIIRYALSDRSFIDKGWTLLPTEKVVRKMNVYRMRPAHPEFDWFEHNKHKRCIQYDTSEKFAEFDDNGRGRWYYRNGRLALDYYDAQETNAQQRFVVYSSGEPDERGRSHPITVLATFDYLGNGIVLDHAGKIRLKYNQTEGVVLDRSIGPVSHWKWHTLNDPPVLQQVMIDTQMSHKDTHILKLGGPGDDKTRPDNEEMLAIEFDNFVKDKNKKLSQKFKPFQIKMKALKINEHFSLRVLDQATIYLIFRDGSTNLKLNIGMVLDHHEIVDTDTAEVGEVSNNLERLPARTDSLAGMQRSIAFAQRFERSRTERERRLRPSEPCASADQLVAAVSRPLRPPLRTVTTAPIGSISNTELCRCSRKPSSNLYYNTRLT